jgi:hypothetical protein
MVLRLECKAMSPDVPIQRRHVRELLRLRALPVRTRLDGLALYATRSWRRKPVALRLERARVYLDPQSLAADWETWRQIFFPKYGIYAGDYYDAVVVDVGAHKGYFAASALRGGARLVLSYEPRQTILRCSSARRSRYARMVAGSPARPPSERRAGARSFM